MLKSPFKFLDPYQPEDKDLFFGRSTEISVLRELLNSSNLILIYGKSGTGKTSLIKGGLSQKLTFHDWLPVTIRRNEHILTSLCDEFKNLIPGDSQIEEDPVKCLNRIYNYYLRPIYLIFDQFEEIFTNKSVAAEESSGQLAMMAEEERRAFFKVIKEILDTDIPSKILFCIREEYIAQLYTYEDEAYLPNLFDFRLRIEPMTRKDVEEVVEKTFLAFNIKNSIPVSKIIENLLTGGAERQLAYLQVYLDNLWRDSYAVDHGEAEWYGRNIPEVTISEGIFTQVGQVSDVLKRYFTKKKTEIRALLQNGPAKEFSDADWEGFEQQFYSNFITQQGTKQPVKYTVNDGNIIRLEMGNFEEAEMVSHYVNELESARIIRKEASFLELAHDSLATIVQEGLTAEQVLIRNIHQSILSNYQIFEESQSGFLSAGFIEIYERYKSKMEFEKPVLDYIEFSRDDNAKKVTELQTALLSSEKRKKRAYILGLLCLGFLIAAIIFGGKFYKNKADLQEALALQKEITVLLEKEKQQNLNNYNKQIEISQKLKVANDLALSSADSLERTLYLVRSAQARAAQSDSRRISEEVKKYMRAADKMHALDNHELEKAILVNAARKYPLNREIRNKIKDNATLETRSDL